MKILVANAQIKPFLGDVESNLKLIEAQVKIAKKKNIKLLVFPELALTGYFLKDFVPDVSQKKNSKLLRKIASLSKGISIVLGFVEESSRHVFYNSAAYFENEKLVYVHRKIYLPTYGMFDESRYFGSGQRIKAFDTNLGRVAILICEDAWHPSLAFLASQDGADFLIVPSSSPFRGTSQAKLKPKSTIERTWESILATYSITYNQFVVFSNRVGYEDGVNFWGGSQIISPEGEILKKGSRSRASIYTAEIDTRDIRRSRIASPTFRDEKILLFQREFNRIQSSKKN
ncbi:MAG: nitrilase-related carbon-nitrogen hydrolase [Nitrospinota bacterium]|nr:nitrilase-related carbon-nitrogen hydrolase [Nitrospinota bacterium]